MCYQADCFGSKSRTGAVLLPCAYHLLHQNWGHRQKKLSSLSPYLLLQGSVMNKWIKQQSAAFRCIYFSASLSAAIQPFNLTANRFIIYHLFPVTPMLHWKLFQRRRDGPKYRGSRREQTAMVRQKIKAVQTTKILPGFGDCVALFVRVSCKWFTSSGNDQRQAEEAIWHSQIGLRAVARGTTDSGNNCTPAGSLGLHLTIPH